MKIERKVLSSSSVLSLAFMICILIGDNEGSFGQEQRENGAYTTNVMFPRGRSIPNQSSQAAMCQVDSRIR